MLDIGKLRTFSAVARLGSFTKASDELHYSQPYVSMQIRDLERSLGVRLIQRSGKRNHLTEAGRLLYERVTQLLDIESSIQASMRAVKNNQRGLVFVGADHLVPTPLVMTAVSEYLALRPNVQVRLDQRHRDTLEAMLLHGEVDVAIFSGEVENPDISLIPWLKEEMVIVIPNILRDTANQTARPYLSLAGQQISQAELDAMGGAVGAALTHSMECSTYALLADAISQGLGVASLPRSLAEALSGVSREIHYMPTPSQEPLAYFLGRLKAGHAGDSAGGFIEAALGGVDPDCVGLIEDER